MLKSRLFLVSVLVLLLALLAIGLTPFAVSNGIRLWIWWAARQECCIASFDKVDTPLVDPFVMWQVTIRSRRDDALGTDLTTAGASDGRKLKQLLLHIRGLTIR